MAPAEANAIRRRHLNLLRMSGYNQLLAGALIGTFESYWMKDLHFSNEFIGTYCMVVLIISFGANLFWGWLADRWGRPARLSAIGCFLYGLLSIVFPLLSGEPAFLAYAAFKGLFSTMAFSFMPILVASVAPPGAGGKTYGDYRIYGTYGFLTATVLLPLILKDVHWAVLGWSFGTIQIFFVIAAVATLLAGLPLLKFCLPPALKKASSHGTGGKLSVVLRKPELIGFFIASFFFSLANPALFTYLPVYAKELGADPQFVGLLSACFGIVGLTCLRAMGWISDRTKPRYLLWIAFAAQPLRALAIACVQDNFKWLMLPQFFHVFTWAGPEVATVYFIGRLVGDENRGRALGIAMSVNVLGGIIGSPLSGWISAEYGYPAMYYGAAAVSSLGFVAFSVCIWLMRRMPAGGPSGDPAAAAAMAAEGAVSVTTGACAPDAACATPAGPG